MKKNKDKKSEFQKSIEEQQKRLEELYRKYSNEFKIIKKIKIPKRYENLVSC
jgi:hypothetical protein